MDDFDTAFLKTAESHGFSKLAAFDLLRAYRLEQARLQCPEFVRAFNRITAQAPVSMSTKYAQTNSPVKVSPVPRSPDSEGLVPGFTPQWKGAPPPAKPPVESREKPRSLPRPPKIQEGSTGYSVPANRWAARASTNVPPSFTVPDNWRNPVTPFANR